jgi:hypothetical protein
MLPVAQELFSEGHKYQLCDFKYLETLKLGKTFKLTFSITFPVYVQLRLMFTLLLLLFVVNIQYMFQANCPFSGVQVLLLR